MEFLKADTIRQGQGFHCQMQREVHSLDVGWLAILTRKESHVSSEIYWQLKVKKKKSS